MYYLVVNISFVFIRLRFKYTVLDIHLSCLGCSSRTVKDGRKEIFYLIGRKEGNVLFNDTLNTFCLRLYGIKHMVKDHSDSEKGNPLPPHGLLFPINSKGSFICTIPQTAQTTAFVTPVVEHWLEREIAQFI